MDVRSPKTPWPPRFGALLCYLGPGLFRRAPHGVFLHHHYNHAATLILLLAVCGAVWFTGILCLSYLLVFHREMYEGVHLERYVLSGLNKVLLCWLVVWVFAVILALLGSMRTVLLVTWLSGFPRMVKAGRVVFVVACVLVLAAAPVAVHADSLVRDSGEPGVAYFVYEDLDTLPAWLFALGFYRVSLATRARFGPGKAVLLRLSEETILRAKAEGQFVVIGAHGRPRGILCDGGWIAPRDIAAGESNPGLRFVYLSSCDSGAQRKAWEEAFAPAEVVTFDRLSAIVEHIWWLWFRAPGELARVTDSG